MVNKLSRLISRAKEIYHEEGLLTTIKRIFGFAKYTITSVVSYENSVFYVYERILKKGNEADRLPKIQNFTHRLLDKVMQLDELLDEGFDLSLLDINQARYRLERGAIVSLVFVNNEFAATSWSALTEEAKRTFNRYPYKVDFANHEICGGASWVNPKYRRQGLDNYSAYKKEQYLIGRGAIRHRGIVLTSNIASQKANDKQGSKVVAKARYIRIFGLQFWREKPYKLIDEER